MSFLSRLRLASLGLGLALTTLVPLHAGQKTQPADRPSLSSLVIQLDNGQSYSLSQKELKAKHGGAIFWGDWAVYNLLVPYHFYNRQDAGPVEVIRTWILPGSNGQLPGFLLKTADGPVNPLDPCGPDHGHHAFAWGNRPKVISIVVGLDDGRSHSLTQEELYDEKSGVLFWNDDAVNNILVPFYYYAKNLPTSPADVINLWNAGVPVGSAATAGGISSLAVAQPSIDDLPGFLVKPRCIPNYPME